MPITQEEVFQDLKDRSPKDQDRILKELSYLKVVPEATLAAVYVRLFVLR